MNVRFLSKGMSSIYLKDTIEKKLTFLKKILR